ncbi:phospholipase [Actinoplanes regularis]|uniref:phospholipase n=1 Tax=Actinoplanes regularis TaxID=52697 RepID=UPI0024A44949|nr:phospholipase [Actinoplanes regularis]GLW31171.1 hypothetical protein Areg01_41110 [Actinoplanes regularis]
MYPHRVLVVLTTTSAVLFGGTDPAAAATAPNRATVLDSFTQITAGSFDAWNSARQDQGKWSSYDLDWRTDYCSDSPDRPLRFDFRLPCWRHDFGYRNYESTGGFRANKRRVDAAFYADLKRKCSTYPSASQRSCNSLAWIYYRAVSIFGTLAPIHPGEVTATAGVVR